MYIVSFGISFVNIVVKTILRLISKFESSHTKTSEIFSSMIKMFIVSFANTGIIIFLVNAQLGIKINGFPVFAGQYEEFTVEWYRIVGSTIVFTMMINIFTPHLSNAMFLTLMSLKRCLDRRCSFSRKRTKKLLQEDYEDVNTGSDFLLEFRYASILTNIYMIFMYSSGLPLLYIVAFVSFFIMYWFDKLFCK